ncbi:hypothetical protein PR048_004352 [Dryococelus australis]|uniref:Mutator-like transposase domain-containing protein n=1 Tax=Dryococelus australis TaxID=614101 RepID=A0ABQ9I564_9NEOP|nr:hypothetical protein PR048_004352 [Dryococelus australis]
MCNVEIPVWSGKDPEKMDVNTAAVSGTISSGGGHAQLEEVISAMYLPVLSTTALKEMQTAAPEEARHAKEKGEVDSDSVPTITVIADGCWSKRSYRTNYTALPRVLCT